MKITLIIVDYFTGDAFHLYDVLVYFSHDLGIDLAAVLIIIDFLPMRRTAFQLGSPETIPQDSRGPFRCFWS